MLSSSSFSEVSKRRRRRQIKRSDVYTTRLHSAFDPGVGKLEVALPRQPRVDGIPATFCTRGSETSDPRHVAPTVLFKPNPFPDELKDLYTSGADTSSPFEQSFQWLLSSVERTAEVLTTSSSRGTERLVFDYSTVSVGSATLFDEETLTPIFMSTTLKPQPDSPFASASEDPPLKELSGIDNLIALDPIVNHTISSSFEHLASIPPLQPPSTNPSTTEILRLFDPLYTGSSLLDPFKTSPPVRRSLNPFMHINDSVRDGLLVNLEEENALMNSSNSNPFRDPDKKAALCSGSTTEELQVQFAAADMFTGSPPDLTLNLGNCSSVDAILAAVETFVARSVARSVPAPSLKLIGGTLSKWAQESLKNYEDGHITYRERIRGHRIVEWRRYRVKTRDPVSGNRHEYIIVKIEHIRSRETHFIRFERWRDKYFEFGGKSGRTIDWSPDLDQVTILEGWVAVDGDIDTLVDKRIFDKDHHELNLLDLFLVARSMAQIQRNYAEFARRPSHWFAVIFSNVLDQDVDRIQQKYSHKRGKLDLTGWLRKSSREERDCAFKFICEFRGKLHRERAYYVQGNKINVKGWENRIIVYPPPRGFGSSLDELRGFIAFPTYDMAGRLTGNEIPRALERA
ncbi:hypothetical protein C0995_013846 [Termitomyces sp. Mi166|nr:hypothetical protein C0995_013846 [Termitomyces sp. Mi166\